MAQIFPKEMSATFGKDVAQLVYFVHSCTRSGKLDCLPVRANPNSKDVGPGTKTMSSNTLKCSLKLAETAQICDNVSLWSSSTLALWCEPQWI